MTSRPSRLFASLLATSLAATLAACGGGAASSQPTGPDGESVTVEDIRPILEANCAKFFLEQELRVQDMIKHQISRTPTPRDGKDGRDGFNLNDFAMEHDGERTFTFKFVHGDLVKVNRFKVPAMLDRGVYTAGREYEHGDGVTFGGSFWIAQTNTSKRPGEGNNDWRLAIKRGRDGKDGERGPKGDTPTVASPPIKERL
jgi:integrin beta 3